MQTVASCVTRFQSPPSATENEQGVTICMNTWSCLSGKHKHKWFKGFWTNNKCFLKSAAFVFMCVLVSACVLCCIWYCHSHMKVIPSRLSIFSIMFCCIFFFSVLGVLFPPAKEIGAQSRDNTLVTTRSFTKQLHDFAKYRHKLETLSQHLISNFVPVTSRQIIWAASPVQSQQEKLFSLLSLYLINK